MMLIKFSHIIELDETENRTETKEETNIIPLVYTYLFSHPNIRTLIICECYYKQRKKQEKQQKYITWRPNVRFREYIQIYIYICKVFLFTNGKRRRKRSLQLLIMFPRKTFEPSARFSPCTCAFTSSSITALASNSKC